jgi:ABC-type bacteriocin/lantibiotic exporter with double-glycine peptidase domain
MSVNIETKPQIDKGLKCLATIAAYYQIPCDPKSLIHQFAKEGSLFTDSDIIRAASFSAIIRLSETRKRRTALPHKVYYTYIHEYCFHIYLIAYTAPKNP